MTSSIWLRAVTALLMFSAVNATHAAQAGGALTVTVDIKAQPVRAALQAFGQQTGMQVLFRSEGISLEGITVPAVAGKLSAEEALERLLVKTGLKYEFVNERTVRVSSASPATTVDKVSMRVIDGQPAEGTHVAQAAGPATSGAQEKSSSTPSETEGDTVQEVIVTAMKREERLIDAPVSVSVLSADDLSRLGATQFRDFANTIPGLSFQTGGAGYTQISLRGVSVGQDIAPTVAVYVDEVPYGASTTFARGGQITLDAGLFDVGRIEVLRGPQGTLYGASTVGGLIKYVTKMPDTSGFSGETRVGVSSTQHGSMNYDVAGAANIPISTDKAALRISGFEAHDGGYIDNIGLNKKDVNSSDIYGSRFDLLLTPTDRLTVRLNGFLQNTSSDGLPTADFTRAGVPVNGSLVQRRVLDESFDQHYRLGSGTVTYDFGGASLTSISSYQTTHSTLVTDATVLYLPSLPVGVVASAVGFSDDSATDKFTQEVRLASSGKQVLEWLVGGFYTHEDSSLFAQYLLRGPSGQSLPNTVYTFAAPSTYKEAAAFGDLTWHLHEKFDVTGGLRYAENRQSFEQIGTGTFGLSAPVTRSTEHVVTYLGNARYRFNDHVAAYLRYATGYRPGGPNVLVINPSTGVRQGLPTFEADRLKSHEIGLKAETDDGRYGMELAAYQVDWDNIQINVVVLGFGTKANAPSGAIIRGTELTLTARPTNALTVKGAFAYQDAKMEQALAAVSAAKDERLPTVPRHTASLNADYEFAVSSLRPTIGATFRSQGGSNTVFGPNGYPLPGYDMVDLRAGMTLKALDLQFYVRNLFDERAQLTPRIRYFPANSPQVSILQPRTLGLMMSTKF